MVRILTDSSSEISYEDAKERNIDLLPIMVTFENGGEISSLDMQVSEFYEKMATAQVLPKTSQINAFTFEEYFESIKKAGDTAVVLPISSGLSGTYQSAVTAAEKYMGIVFVVDVKTTTFSLRDIVYRITKLRDNGMQARELAKEAGKIKDKARLYAYIDTLRYLKMGGRVSGAQAAIGTVLNIKPIITVEKGLVEVIGKERGQKNALDKIISLFLENNIDYEQGITVASSNGNADDYAMLSEAIMAADRNITRSMIAYSTIGPTIGTHVGPGAIAMSFFTK